MPRSIDNDTGKVLNAAESKKAQMDEALATTPDQAKNLLDLQVASLEQKKKVLVDYYKGEEQCIVSGTPRYQPQFGRTMPVIINGIAIYVPLDGQQYMIPKTFAAEFLSRLAAVDEDDRTKRALSDISRNSEAYAGELTLIKNVSV